ncbi:hypothetical protein [Bradyrhizobium sp.]
MNEGSLTQRANEMAQRNRAFQMELTEAVTQVAVSPGTAVERLRKLLPEADAVEALENGFLQEQLAQAANIWAGNRLQILMAQAQALMVLGRFDEAGQAITEARKHLSGDITRWAAPALDELEVTISQARGA